MWILSLRSPQQKPREYVLHAGKTILGRSKSNQIIIEDESASRQHAEINNQHGSLTIRDLDSTNGTFINREQINQITPLEHGDQIRIGFHVAKVYARIPGEADPETGDSSQGTTQPLTRDLLIEAVDKNAILLHEFSTRLTTILDLDQTLRDIADFLSISTGANKCQVILAEKFDQIDKMGFSKTLANQAIQKKSIIVIPDTYHIESISDSAFKHRIKTALCIPIICNDVVIALAYAYKTDRNARPFDQNDIQLAIAISHQAALAIHRSQILEQAKGFEQLAQTDRLTGLNNRRHFDKVAKLEFDRARRFAHALSIMIIDIDDFKQINDSYGHLVGDQVLIEVAQRLQNNVRNIDFLARYGGDEFVIILVEADEIYASNIGQRIHHSVTENNVETDRGSIEISISAGIATLQAEHSNEFDVLRIADDALLTAKDLGKNQIAIA